MAITIKISKEGLKVVDQARKKKGWAATAQTWCTTAQTSLATLKRFREGKAIQQDAFVKICEAVNINWEDVISDSSQNIEQTTSTISQPEFDFFAYDKYWVGRQALLTDLQTKIEEKTRIMLITGITGIGKTALAEYLINYLTSEKSAIKWQNFIWQNFDDQIQTIDFTSTVKRWLEKIGKPINPDNNDKEKLLKLILDHLLNHPCLLFMDSLEFILKGNEEEGWSNFQDVYWVKLFEGLLSSQKCASLVLLTSQDFPAQIPLRYSQFIHCQTLTGLSHQEQIELFWQMGLETDNEEYLSYLSRIGTVYEGHPLALRVIAGEIGDKPFYSNVIAYWHQYGHEIEEIERAIEEAKNDGITTSSNDQWKLHQYTRNLRRRVKTRLEQTLYRLKTDCYFAYVLLCQAAVFRCPVKSEFWLDYLKDWNLPTKWQGDNQELLLDILRDRYLVEETTMDNIYLIRQHNLVRSIALVGLKQLDEEYEQSS